MKTYRVIIEPNPEAIDEWVNREDAVTMDRMELIFTIGDRALGKLPPDDLAASALRDLSLARWMTVTSVEQIDPSDYIGLRPDGLDIEPEPELCPVCHSKHDPKNIFSLGLAGSLISGHEYIVITKTSQQKYPREWRMGFLGAYGGGLQFSARGPDRTHKAQYGGTQTIDENVIVAVREIERDDAKRHTGVRLAGSGIVAS